MQAAMKPTLSQTNRATDAEIGKTIRRLRKQAGISQEALACAIGVTFQQVQKYENATNRIAVSTFIRICLFLGVGPMDVIGDHFGGVSDEPNPASRIARRLAEAEQQLAQIRAIAFPNRRVAAGLDLSDHSEPATLPH